MSRACTDCATPISPRSSGRCRSCAMIAVNRSDAVRLLSSKRTTERNLMPRRPYEKPPEWCPAPYHPLYRKMVREQFDEGERRRIIFEDMTAQARRSGAIR